MMRNGGIFVKKKMMTLVRKLFQERKGNPVIEVRAGNPTLATGHGKWSADHLPFFV
jgi:hypothetical protein